MKRQKPPYALAAFLFPPPGSRSSRKPHGASGGLALDALCVFVPTPLVTACWTYVRQAQSQKSGTTVASDGPGRVVFWASPRAPSFKRKREVPSRPRGYGFERMGGRTGRRGGPGTMDCFLGVRVWKQKYCVHAGGTRQADAGNKELYPVSACISG